MISLNKTVVKKYAYVKGTEGVIFNIKSTDSGDACVAPITEETVPYIETGKTEDDKIKLYFDGYIEVGDTYKADTEGGDKVFKKTVHSTTREADESMTYQDYYKKLCENAIADALISNYTWTYDDFKKDLSMLGVPAYMIKQSNIIVTPASVQIDFTQAYYNTSKEKRIKELAYESACNVVDKYGYKLTSPAKASDLVIAKKS